MEPFVITEKMLEAALSYMPLAQKESLAKAIAKECVKSIPTAEQNLPGNKVMSLPEPKGEDWALKAVLLQNTLLGFYFDIELDPEADPYETYDYYASAHIAEQLGAYKSRAETRTKAFQILNDYKEFKKMVEVEVYNLKLAENDTLARFGATLGLMSDPESIRKASEELKKAAEEYTDALRKRNIVNRNKANGENKHFNKVNGLKNKSKVLTAKAEDTAEETIENDG